MVVAERRAPIVRVEFEHGHLGLCEPILGQEGPVDLCACACMGVHVCACVCSMCMHVPHACVYSSMCMHVPHACVCMNPCTHASAARPLCSVTPFPVCMHACIHVGMYAWCWHLHDINHDGIAEISRDWRCTPWDKEAQDRVRQVGIVCRAVEDHLGGCNNCIRTCAHVHVHTYMHMCIRTCVCPGSSRVEGMHMYMHVHALRTSL